MFEMPLSLVVHATAFTSNDFFELQFFTNMKPK